MSRLFYPNLSFVDVVKRQYLKGDVCMSELLRVHDELTVAEKRELLDWSGDCEYMKVTSSGEIVEKVYA